MDRIDDAYNGLMGDEFMRKTRERMHWICSKVEGGTVLDVGCSQGTLARLLASAGKSVFGVDVNPEAIAYANAKREETDEATNGRLRFQCGNFMDFKTDERFDTVVMGEILEHLPIPEAFIQKAHLFLKQGGIYVVTVPFGINDDPDHRQTFYWTWIIEKFAPYFEVKEVKIFGRWIGVVGLKRDSKCSVEQMVPLSAVEELERAFYALERPLVNDCKARTLKLQAQKDFIDEAKRNLADSRSEISSLKVRAEKAASDCAKLKMDLGAALEKKRQMFEQIETLRHERDVARADLSEKKKKVAWLETTVRSKDSEIGKLEAAVKSKDSEIDKLGAAVRSKDSEIDKLGAAVRSKDSEIDKLGAAVRSKDSELVKAKRVNENLLGKNKQTNALYSAEKKKYDKLAKAKLGRLTLAYWRIKDSIKAKLRGGKISPKNCQATNSPVLSAPSSERTRPVTAVADKLPKGDEGFFKRMAPKIIGMPVSNGSRYYERIPVKIGIICDRFYWDAINSAAEFVYVSPNTTEEVLAKLDCMLVVSTWRGLENEDWRGLGVAKGEHPMRIKAYGIIDCCRRNNIPTIFYSKEDPPNYAVYIGLAQKCDFVFTSAEECIPDYRRDCGHDRVYPMRFCVNPIMHNPIGMRHAREKERNVIFSGSWMEKYPQRCRDLEMIFNGIIDSGRGLNIVDRNYEHRDNPRYCYPEKYRKFQSPAIDHGDLQKVHKLFDWAVNINSVKNSMTMFANRAYELLASGNLMLSNYSIGISKTLPTIFLIQSSEEVVRILNAYSEEEVYERQMSGVRRVMTGETCFDRISEILDMAGIRRRMENDRKVLVIADKVTDRIQSMFDGQSLRNKSLIASADLTGEIYDSADVVAFFDPDADYGAFYLEDMVNGFKYTDCDYVTKDAFVYGDRVVSGVEHSYVDLMPDKARTVFWRNSFRMDQLLSLGENVKIPNGYSIDHFSFKVNCKKQG